MTSAPAAVDETSGQPASAPPPSLAGTLTHRQILTIFVGLMLGMFLAALDQTIVTTAIRTIGDDLDGLSLQAWVTTAYLITATISTPLYGKLSDIYGRKPLFLLAISVFILGSAACSFSTSMYMLAAFRAFQGLGAGGLFSLALAIIADIVSPRERARYQGYFLAVFGTSSVIGPLVGGAFAGQHSLLFISGWRWVFLVNVPIGVMALFVVWHTLNIPHYRREHRIDWKGAVALIVGLVPLLIIAEQGRTWGWASTRGIVCYAVGIAGLLLFVLAESRLAEDALIPLRFFRNHTFSLTAISRIIFGAGMFGAIQLLPLYLQIVKGASPTKSGLLMLPLTGGIMFASVASGQLISKTGRYKIFPIIGGILLCGSLAAMHFISADSPFWQTAVYMAVFGLGLGNILQPITLAVQNAMPARDIGVATSSATFFQQVGATIGVAAFLSVLFSTVGDKIKNAYTNAGHTSAFTSALKDPAVLHNPHNAPILKLLHGNGVSGSDLNNTAFLNGADKNLAHPFFVGFSQSMDLVFIIGAGVVFIGFVLMLFLREIPLRTQSGMQSAAADRGENGTAAPAPEAPVAPAAAAEPVVATADDNPAGNPDDPASKTDEVLAPVWAGAVVGQDNAVGGHAGRHSVGTMNGFSPTAPGSNGAEGSVMTDNSTTSAHGSNGASAPVGTVVRGRVRQPNGAPVGQAALTLIDPAGRQAGRHVTESDGSYQLTVPANGHYVLIARAASHQPQASTIDVNGTPVDFDVILTGSSGLLGTVRNGNAEPITRATVTVTDVHGEVVTTRSTNVAGTYTINDLVAGDYTLVVTAPGFRPAALMVTVPTTGKVEQDVELIGGAHLQGTTRAGTDQHALPDARVSLIDADGNVVATSRTDESGGYSFDDVPSGDYTVTATSYPPVTSVVHINTGEEQQHDIELGYPDERR
ncbi:MAG TPA: DHA2 family efflux MFS transporter permease subunit [Mycobacteriales bacterium]|jgi:EmrB/QacA subfamily drug resistance transporter|nr:DHA2 family efflux MFS transporter permease subunit [Mycobacteriales bacterium]